MFSRLRRLDWFKGGLTCIMIFGLSCMVILLISASYSGSPSTQGMKSRRTQEEDPGAEKMKNFLPIPDENTQLEIPLDIREEEIFIEPDVDWLPMPPGRHGGNNRDMEYAFSALLQTDKPVYKPMDYIIFQVLFIHSLNKTFINCGRLTRHINLKFSIKDMNGNNIYEDDGISGKPWKEACQYASLAYSFQVPEDLNAGIYVAHLSTLNSEFPPTYRTFRVKQYSSKEVIVRMDKDKEQYYEEETAYVHAYVRRATGGRVGSGAMLTLTHPNGDRKNFSIEDGGDVYFSYYIPKGSRESDSVGIEIYLSSMGSTYEQLIIPIIQGDVTVTLTPESGFLVPGFPNKVYYQIHTLAGLPVSVCMKLSQHMEETPSAPRTIINGVCPRDARGGRGYFEYTPGTQGERYTLSVPQPVGLPRMVTLPNNYGRKVGFRLFNKGVQGSAWDLDLDLDLQFEIYCSQCTTAHPVDVYIYLKIKEITIYNDTLSLVKGTLNYSIPMHSIVENIPNGGVIIFQIYNTSSPSNQNLTTIIGERLIFIPPSKKLSISINNLTPTNNPIGSKMEFTVQIANPKSPGEPTSEGVMANIRVVESVSFNQIPTKIEQLSLPTMVLMEKEVFKPGDERELPFLEKYIGGLFMGEGGEFDPLLLDILLGNQGWRQFLFLGGDLRKIYDLVNSGIGSEDDLLIDQVRELAGGGVSAGIIMYDMMAMDDMMEIEMMPMAANERGVEAPMAGAGAVEEKGYGNTASQNGEGGDMDKITQLIKQGFMIVHKYQKHYVHRKILNYQPDLRVDFTESLFIGTAIPADNTGSISVSFDTSDRIGEFIVFVDAFTQSGYYGLHRDHFSTIKNYYINTQLPFTSVVNDIIKTHIHTYNYNHFSVNSNLSIKSMKETVKIEKIEKQLEGDEDIVPPMDLYSAVATLTAIHPGDAFIELSGKGDPIGDTTESENIYLSDKLISHFNVIPQGFREMFNQSGMLTSQIFTPKEGTYNKTTLNITLPEHTIFGIGGLTVKLFPTPVGSLNDALERLIRDPYGCFEQTSSTNYPLVMAIQYLKSHRQTENSTRLIISGMQKLRAGYKKLITFEASNGGYEWFGSNPGHEALTAYGLMQFVEMGELIDIDTTMLDRVKDWLLSRGKDDGSFELSSQSIDSFGRAPKNITCAYITWALSCMGYKNLTPQINYLLPMTDTTTDPYFLGLVMNILHNIGGEEYISKATSIGDKLVNLQSDVGSMEGAETSITNSHGESLTLESTSLVVLGWLGDSTGRYVLTVENAVKYIINSVKDGKYSTTQATVLCLKALIKYDESKGKIQGKAIFLVTLGGNVLDQLTLSTYSEDVIQYKRGYTSLLPNQNPIYGNSNIKITVELASYSYTERKDSEEEATDFDIPYYIELEYYNKQPSTSPSNGFNFTLLLLPDKDIYTEGEGVQFKVNLQNTLDRELGMTVAVVRLPAAFSINFNDLERLKQEGKVSSFELLDSDLILYWRGIRGNEEKEININAIVAFGGVFVGRPSCVYEYYNPANVAWLKPYSVSTKLNH